jgi:OmpA-OmpF porin, OOP family
MLTKQRIFAATILGVISLSAATNSSAGLDGPYIGGEVGYGDIHQSHVGYLNTTSSSSTGIAGRGFGGYQFSQMYAMEVGYTKFSNADVKGTSNVLSGISKVNYDTYAIDFVARVSIPVGVGFDVFGKLGAAYLKEISTLNGTSTAPGSVGVNVHISDMENKVFPTFGVGASYDFSPNILGDVSWMHIQRLGDNPVRNTDFVGLGLTYNFG